MRVSYISFPHTLGAAQQSHWKSQGGTNKASHKGDGTSEVPFGADRKRRQLAWENEYTDDGISSSSSSGSSGNSGGSSGNRGQRRRSLSSSPLQGKGGDKTFHKVSPSHALRPLGLVLGPTASALESALPNVTTHIGNTAATAQASRNAVGWAAKHGLQHQHLSIANMPNM